MRPLKESKLFAGLVSAVGAAVLALGILTAGAAAAPNPGPPLTKNPDGPQSANIPYVAWVGEHVRLVVCDPSINPSNNNEGTKQQFSTFSTEDWSGYQFQPPTPDGFSGNNLLEEFNPGPSAFFESSSSPHAGDGCVATIYKSLNPGLARIKVDVRDQEDPGSTVFSHQFLVIWLTANKPTVHEASVSGGGTEVFQGKLNPTGLSNLKHFLGDPEGNGVFAPSPFDGNEEEDKGLVQIRVTGNFPVVAGAPLSNILPKPEYTLPTDWETLAKTLSSSSEETDEPGDNPGLWDIHGSPGSSLEGEETKIGPSGNVCTTASLIKPTSATDNCNGGTTQFSRVFGDLTSEEGSTIGPFDPQLSNQTLLSDGRLNADDAPMPSMRVDVSIAPSNHTIGGVGTIEEASKSKIYSHDFTGNSTAHNLYNPYYQAYLPATDRPNFNEVSGVAGPDHGSDFPGFLNSHPDPYNYWETVNSYTSEHSDREVEPTHCFRRTLPEPEEYASPSGHLTETVYTDERGEAYVTYKPGDAFYLNRLPKFLGNPGEEEEGKVIKNADRGCDLKGVHNHVIGESSISANAIYPYEPVDYPSQTSEPVVKKVVSKWEKEWFVFRKSVGRQYESVRIIVAKAQDIDGKPIPGEKVCFSVGGFASAEAFMYSLEDPTEQVGRGPLLYLGGTGPEEREGTKLCLHTNDEGLAAIELDNGSFVGADLPVNFVDEGIIRDHVIGEPPAIVTPPEGVPGTQNPPNSTPAPDGSASPITSSVGTVSVLSATVSKPLTVSQKLHKALNACKKKPKKARIACEKKARNAYQAKAKPKKVVAPPKVGLG